MNFLKKKAEGRRQKAGGRRKEFGGGFRPPPNKYH
jgi:hypothetical protein